MLNQTTMTTTPGTEKEAHHGGGSPHCSSGADIRVVQITPTGEGHTSIEFGARIPIVAPPGSMRHLELVTPDIIATREELVERGINVTEVYHGAGSVFWPESRISGPDPDRTSYASYASFEDPDGNGWTLQEVTHAPPGP
jgi:hypothetical protein